MKRYRWVYGNVSVDCDLMSAMVAYNKHGGRIDQSTVTAYPDGSELLGVWQRFLPSPNG